MHNLEGERNLSQFPYSLSAIETPYSKPLRHSREINWWLNVQLYDMEWAVSTFSPDRAA